MLIVHYPELMMQNNAKWIHSVFVVFYCVVGAECSLNGCV